MSGKSQSILLAALVYAVLSVLLSFVFRPGAGGAAGMLGTVLGCVVLLGVGALAVWHYTTTNNVTVPGGAGAGMGAAAGAIGAIAAGIISLVLVSIGVMPDPMELMIAEFERQGMTDDQIDMMTAFSNPLITFGTGAIIGAIAGAIGGAIGAAMFKRGGTTEPTY